LQEKQQLEKSVRRFLGGFKSYGERFQVEIELTGVPLSVLKSIFQPPPSDPLMYDCYNVDEEQSLALQPYASERIDLSLYKYQLQAESDA
jgi:hypothetical protein